MLALAVVCLAGVAVAATILYVHGQIDRLGNRYTSFCSINDTVNCDRVLASEYAKIAGFPIAWMALAAYAGMAAIFASASRADEQLRRRLIALGSAGVVGALVFSGYMAVVAAFRLETLCLLCAGLYTVALTNAAITVSMLRGFRNSAAGSPFGPGAAAGVFSVATIGVVALAWLTWPAGGQAAASLRSAEDVRRADPDFYAWYTALPKVDVASLVRDDQVATLSRDKVVIVDFFDLECAHCKKNYQLVKQLMAVRGGEVQLVHRHFPLDASCNDIVPVSLHPDACRAAEAVECAGLQGKHDEMIDILFANQGQLFAENLPRLAGKIGLDKDALERCLDEHRTLPLVLADARAGARLDITSTPTVFIGGRRITGALEEVGKYEMAVVIDAVRPH